MIVIVTGSRDWTDEAAVIREIDKLKPSYLVLGDCETGVDNFARKYASKRRISHSILYADWDRYGNSAGPRRNREMVKLGIRFSNEPIICLAFPQGKSSGTRNCMAEADASGIEVKEYKP